MKFDSEDGLVGGPLLLVWILARVLQAWCRWGLRRWQPIMAVWSLPTRCGRDHLVCRR